MKSKVCFVISLLISPLIIAGGYDNRPVRERRTETVFSGSLYHTGTQVLFEIRRVRLFDRGARVHPDERVSLWLYVIESYGFGHTAADTMAVNSFYLPPGIFLFEEDTNHVRFSVDLADTPDITVGYRAGGGVLEERGIEVFRGSMIAFECAFEAVGLGDRETVSARYDDVHLGVWSKIKKTRVQRPCVLEGSVLGMEVGGFRGSLSSRVEGLYLEGFQTILRSSSDVPVPEVDFPLFYRRDKNSEAP